jgi:hypothetical protein
MVLNGTFNNISVTCKSWRWSVVLVVETGVSGENNQPASSHWQTLSHNVASSTPRLERNSISPSWRVLGKNGRMWCQNLITWLRSLYHVRIKYICQGVFILPLVDFIWNCSESVVFLVFIFKSFKVVFNLPQLIHNVNDSIQWDTR